MANLEMINVDKSFGGLRILDSVSLAAAEGEFVVFVGPSGCGKSTLLRLVAGLDEPTGGDIKIGGESVVRVPSAARGVAMVFQSYALYPHMTVRENLNFSMENFRIERGEAERRIADAAKLLQIDGLLGRKPGQLSGGQRQRVAIGRAIVRKPRLFLFDEPLSNLDAELRVQMRLDISALHRRLRNTMIYVTHDQVEAMTMADRIVVLRGGRVEQVGAPMELFLRPVNRFVAGFIGSPRMNFYPGIARAESGALRVDLGEIGPVETVADPAAARDGDAVILGIRPQHVEIAPAAESGGDGAFAARLSAVEALGAETFLHGKLPGGAPVTAHQAGVSAFAVGDELRVKFPSAHCHVFGGEDEKTLPRRAGPEEDGAAA